MQTTMFHEIPFYSFLVVLRSDVVSSLIEYLYLKWYGRTPPGVHLSIQAIKLHELLWLLIAASFLIVQFLFQYIHI